MGWWANKMRRFMRYFRARISPAERLDLTEWLTGPQLELFDSMHPSDQRHGVDVVAALRRGGHVDADLLLAGLLHDCGKGRDLRLWHRVGWSLVEPRRRLKRVVLWLPTFRQAFATLAQHPERSAELAIAARCSHRVASLIRNQASQSDEVLTRALRLADEAN